MLSCVMLVRMNGWVISGFGFVRVKGEVEEVMVVVVVVVIAGLGGLREGSEWCGW